MHRNDKDLLARMPPAPWEGWFCICIPHAGGSVRWIKTHLYRHRKLPGLHPVSAFEGLSARGELTTFVATGDAVHAFKTEFAPKDVRAHPRDFALALDEEFALSGSHPAYGLRRKRAGLGLHLELRARDRLSWLRAPGLLSYFGLHSDLTGNVAAAGMPSEELRGLGVLEHAWGGLLPVDPQRLVRGTWQWDVLSFERCEGALAESTASVAALSVPIPIRGSRGVRSWGRLPGEAFGRLPPLRIDYLEFAEAPSEEGQAAVRYPRRWVGRLGEALEYEAQASTPLARAVRDGGFFGFEFEARYRSRPGDERKLSGNGFSEAGSPKWRL